MIISKDAIIWAYRLFLDREPENDLVVSDKLACLRNTADIRRDFMSSSEFITKNPVIRTLSLSGHEPSMPIESSDDLNGLFAHIQNVWEDLGKSEPHWSVLTWDKFMSNGEGTEEEFYNTGKGDVDRLLETLKRNSIDINSLDTCLEFGCGVGRITSWLSQKFKTVIGYDISRAHLHLAQQHFDKSSYKNISLHHLRELSDIEKLPQVDLVFSVIVLQHNPPPIIKLIIKWLIRALNPGGIAFFQVPTYRNGYSFILKNYLSDEIKNHTMEMHVLPQNELFEVIHNENGKVIEVLEDGYTGLRDGERSNTFVVQKR